MKAKKICKRSGIECETFGYRGKHRHLPSMLRYTPQHIIYKDSKIRLLYFKPSYDNRFVEMTKEEIVSVRQWASSVAPVIVLVYNYVYNNYTIVDMDHVTEKMWSTKRERDAFLFNNGAFQWRRSDEPFTI